MKDSMIRIVPTVLCAITASAMTTNANEIPQRWVLTQITHPDFALSITAMNEAGEISGTAEQYVDGFIHKQPYIWQDGVLHLIEAPSHYIKTYELNNAGTGMAIDHTADHVYHYTTKGMIDLGHLGDLFGANIYMHGMNSSGQFAGHRPLGSDIYNAFTWNQKQGIVYIAPDKATSYAFDVNEYGAVVGATYTDDSLSGTAYLYANGTRTDFGSRWDGQTIAHDIDDAERILVSEYRSGITTFHMVDANDFSSSKMTTFSNADSDIDASMNESGMAFFTWKTPTPNDGHIDGKLALWTEEDGLVSLEVPANSIHISKIDITDSGWLLLHSHDHHYESRKFITSPDNEMIILNDRIIGYEFMEKIGPLHMNETGQIATLVKISESIGWIGGVFSPARPGDVDGDGTVGVNDLLAVSSAWGDWPVGSTCGPDLDMDGSVNINDLLAVISDWH